MNSPVPPQRMRPQADASWPTTYLAPGDYPTSEHERGFLDLTVLRGVLYRQRLVLLGSVLALLALGFLVSLLMPPVFKATASVVVDPYAKTIVEGEKVERDLSVNDVFPYLMTLGDIIESRRMAGNVFDSLTEADRLAILGDAADAPPPAGMTDTQVKAARRETGAATLARMAEAKVPFDSRTISIEIEAPDAGLAARIADAYADNIAMEDVRKTAEANSYAQRYLSEQVAKVRVDLLAAERAANNYAKSNGIVAQVAASQDERVALAEGSPTVTASTLGSVNQAFNEARAKRIAAQQRWAAVSGVPADQLPQVQENGAIQALVERRSQAVAELAELRERYGESHPQIQELAARVATLDRQIARESADVKRGIRLEYDVAQRQEQGLAAELDRAAGSAMNEQDRRVGFDQLAREAEALRNQLTYLLERYNQLSSAANVESSGVTKLDRAQVPSAPSSPNLLRNLLIALVVGLGLGLVLAILREALDDRLRSPEDVERKLGMPILGLTPDTPVDEIREREGDAYGALMEAYSSIRAVLDTALPRDHNVIQVASCQPGEGKTLTAIALAQKSALIGRKVLLIDADLRRPTISHAFGMKRPDKGVAEVLQGHAELKDALIDVGTPNLSVLPVGTIPPNPVELLSSGAVENFIARHRDEFDMIVFDSSPVIGLADSLRLSNAVDATIFIAEANKAHYGQIKASMRQLRSAGANLIGVVLTKYKARDAGQTYDYQYNYYAYGSKQAA